MILTQLGLGENATIVAIEGGRDLRQKLLLRGLFEGKAVRLVSNFNYGPVIVEVDRSLVAIGRGMAKKIQVVRC
jgi:ferrous iron transport protein A